MLGAGTKLGRYEIRSKIGEGGMGEVYRARDEKLNRDGSQARWRRDGKELFYLGGDRKITAVDVNTEAAAFAHGTPKALFETRISKGEDRPGNQYVVTSDGQRFLVNTVAEEGAYTPINVVLNWTAGLKK